MRSSLTGSSASGLGAPIASGLKKLRGRFMWLLLFSRAGPKALTPSRDALYAHTLYANTVYASRTPNSRRPTAVTSRAASLQRNIRPFDHFAPELGLVGKEPRRFRAALVAGFHL